MKIGLIDVDSHRFPNLALMKISAYHKKHGDMVEWYQPLISGHMDKVYKSKVFTFTDDYIYPIDADEVIEGGTGYDKWQGGLIIVLYSASVRGLKTILIKEEQDEKL